MVHSSWHVSALRPSSCWPRGLGEERSEEGGLGSHRAGALPIPSLVLGLLWRGWGVVIGHVKNVSQGPQQSSTTLPPRRGRVRVEGCLVSLEVGGQPLGTDL